MRRSIEGLESFAMDVILDRRHGWRADALRLVLLSLSGLYYLIVQSRLALYRNRIFRSHSHGVLVISVGNLTVGGTGKDTCCRDVGPRFAAGWTQGGDSQSRL